ncbi:MAG: class I SAM-dependent methyltransferase [Streptosporangiaceae bacterium]
MNTHARRASSFGKAAAAYAEHRPDYPAAAIAWAIEPVASRTGRPLRIVDLGAGTGKLTAALIGQGPAGQGPAGRATVIAVEPDPQMLAELRRRAPGVTTLAGRAEAIPLPSSSVDVVICGQAMHWFAPEIAMPEIARVLTHGGVVAGLWNAVDDRVDWVAGLQAASGRDNTASVSSFSQRGRSDDGDITSWLRAAGTLTFGAAERGQFPHGHARTADSLIETLRTHSMFLIMDPPEREAALARVRAYLATTPQTADGEFVLPMQTIALRAVRR